MERDPIERISTEQGYDAHYQLYARGELKRKEGPVVANWVAERIYKAIVEAMDMKRVRVWYTCNPQGLTAPDYDLWMTPENAHTMFGKPDSVTPIELQYY